jgi:hypothetical protein
MLKTLTGYWKSLLTLLAGGAVTGAIVTDILNVSPTQGAAIATLIAAVAVLVGPRNKTPAERSEGYKADSEAA